MPNYFQLQVSGFVAFSVSYHFKSHIFEFLCWKFTFHWHLINSTIIQLRRKYLQAKKREQNPLLVAAIISSKYLCLFSSTLKPSKYCTLSLLYIQQCFRFMNDFQQPKKRHCFGVCCDQALLL